MAESASQPLNPPLPTNGKRRPIPPKNGCQFTIGHAPANQGDSTPPFRQAVILQRLAFKAAHQKGIKPSALSQLMRAWSELEERKRILKMRFRPGDLRPADLDPVNFARLLKRHPRQKLINLPAAPAVFTEAEVVEQPSAPAAANLEDRTHGSNAESPKAQ
jgi:hypothetical protein